jgi:hypothetical protein
LKPERRLIARDSPGLREERMSAFVYLGKALDIGRLVETLSRVSDSADCVGATSGIAQVSQRGYPILEALVL